MSSTKHAPNGAEPATELNFRAQKPAGRIIRAADLPFWLNGNAYLDAAKAAFEDAQQNIPRIVAGERAKGYEQGRDAGIKDVIDLMAQMQAKAQSHYRRLNQDIAELVIRSVQEIVGAIEPGEAISSTVLKALKALDLGAEFTLYVAPQVFDDVREKLLAALDAATQSKLLLRQDPKLPLTGCRLVSEFGVVDLSIEKQLVILADSLRAAGVGIEL
jgi:type III secretion protein L